MYFIHVKRIVSVIHTSKGIVNVLHISKETNCRQTWPLYASILTKQSLLMICLLTNSVSHTFRVA